MKALLRALLRIPWATTAEIEILATASDSLFIKLWPHENDSTPMYGQKLHYKSEFSDWETHDIKNGIQDYVTDDLI